MTNPLETLGFLKKKPALHKLKWKIPEARLTVEVKDAEETVGKLRKKARFITGGEFIDTVYYKKHGENTYTYFTIRIDKRTEDENLLFDGYMIQEEEVLNLEVASAYTIQPHLEKLGYQKAFERDVTTWQFLAGIIRINVYSVEKYGEFIEIALPPTKFVKAREVAEKFAYNLLEKIGIKKEEVIPTDVNTLELTETRQQTEGEGKQLF